MSSRAQRSNLAFFRAAGQRGWAGVLALCFCSCFAQSDLSAAQDALDRQDYPAALRAFLAMAEAEDGLAQSSLGVMHERGMGTPADNAKALYWFSLALLQGNAQARYNLQMCGKYLNEAQRSEYNRRLVEWQATRK